MIDKDRKIMLIMAMAMMMVTVVAVLMMLVMVIATMEDGGCQFYYCVMFVISIN